MQKFVTTLAFYMMMAKCTHKCISSKVFRDTHILYERRDTRTCRCKKKIKPITYLFVTNFTLLLLRYQ